MTTPSMRRLGATGERWPCDEAQDHTQPCNPEGAAWTATGSDGRERLLCSNHAARLAQAQRWPFPPTSPPRTDP